ncbi:uncharacterized protein LOC105259563 isoform X2 [Camponotus floridanus]|uniref:uncharacterized protein LOC105259563 isoform X2 n=1 Tax=Camponotus floridanus TaxID=104421 RepID=UPI00059DCCB4|nr:uncharacterized protein LOC105259563 isoform X2 [Camponotus floridanus]
MSEKSNMAERCRICLSDHGCMTDMHDEIVEAKLKDLTKCTCIDVKYEENLPSVVCHVCLYKLDMWSEFKEQFIQSNKILLEQLEISEMSDISGSVKDSHKDETATENMKRKHLNRSEDSISDNEKKKSKADVSSSELINVDRDTGQIILDVISLSDDEDKIEGPTLSKESSRKVDSDNSKKTAENGSKEVHTESKTSGPMRTRLLPPRRGRNIERRKASTKRWVERKKALLAATGENISDTDSIISDDTQLSPVQKARAKNNADKEAERQKRIAKVLKNLEMNLTEKYSAIRDRDTDSDTRRTRLSLQSTRQDIVRQDKTNSLSPTYKKNVEKNISSLESSIEQENSPVLLENNITTDVKKPESQVDDEPFTPCTLKSELVIGDVTYAVTSMLIAADKESSNNITKDSGNSNVDDNREKNTDIIDAVQLRRVNNPIMLDANIKLDNKSVERCLNIEVEGNQLSILKRVQVELADFVKKEMKHRIFGTNDSVAKTLFPDKLDDVSAVSRQKLDQKLKGIIERSIKKNIETSIRNADDTCGFTKVSPTFTKAAMNLPKYQPKAASRGSSHGGSINLISRKRQIVPPIRYNDYNTSALESDSENSSNMISPKAASKTSPEHARTHGNLGRKKSPGTNKQIVTPVKRIENNSIVKVMDNGAKWTPLLVEQKSTNEQKADYEDAIRIEGAITENHICGVCALTFNSRKEVEAHVRTHKIMTSANVTQVVTLQNENAAATLPRQKQKMMRCKRCHEIVEARFVKSHICKTATEVHKCYVCNSMFRTEKLLVRHLESHDQSEFNIVNAIGNKKSGTVDVSQTTQSAIPQDDQGTETVMKTQNLSTEKNNQSDIQSDKVTSTGVKLDSADNIAERYKETYTCFVCDKIFTDEEVLKDHLQKHCDDLSEGEQSNSKEQFQCAICGDTLESDQALEEHVGKHLFDDEDDNPNLISINQDNKSNKTKEVESYCCGQCSEAFDSEMSLEIHMQEHAEEVAIAEWEKQGMRVINQYQCMLCDELFDVEDDLAEHLDIHNANAHVCQLCDKPFRTLEDLQEHVATH